MAREIVKFGLPMMAAQLSGITARRGDNLAFSKLLGLGRMGAYNLAYNLADVPAATVGERIGDVLVPSFAKIPPAERPAALARSAPSAVEPEVAAPPTRARGRGPSAAPSAPSASPAPSANDGREASAPDTAELDDEPSGGLVPAPAHLLEGALRGD